MRPGREHTALTEGTKGEQSGFVLIESVVAIACIAIIMSAVAAFLVTAVTSAAQLRAKQTAATLATTAADTARNLNADGARAGRTQAAVNIQFAGATSAVQPWLNTMQPAVGRDTEDPTNPPPPPVLPTSTVHNTVNNIDYSLNYYVGLCLRSAGDSPSALTCDAQPGPGYSVPAGKTQFVRVVIAVSWQGPRCGSAGCNYITAVLLNQDPDPRYFYNTDPPPPTKVLCPDVSSSIGSTTPKMVVYTSGDPENGICTFTGGVAAKTYQVLPTADGSQSLPITITDPSTGALVVKAGTVKGTYKGRIQVTDAFGRTYQSADFTWRIYDMIAPTQPGPQINTVNVALPELQMKTTGGSGGPLTWSFVSGRPPGVDIDMATGKITGTPTTEGTYSVVIKVVDETGRGESTVSFNWLVRPNLAITGLPAARSMVVGTPYVSTPVTSNCVKSASPSIQCKFSFVPGAAKPDWLTIDPDSGVLSGTPASVNFQSFAGMVQVTETVGGASRNSEPSATFQIAVNTNIAMPTKYIRQTGGNDWCIRQMNAGEGWFQTSAGGAKDWHEARIYDCGGDNRKNFTVKPNGAFESGTHECLTDNGVGNKDILDRLDSKQTTCPVNPDPKQQWATYADNTIRSAAGNCLTSEAYDYWTNYYPTVRPQVCGSPATTNQQWMFR